MFTHYKLLSIVLLFAGLVYGQSCNLNYQNTQLPPSGATKLDITYPSDWTNVVIKYVRSSSENVEVNVSYCGSANLFANYTNSDADSAPLLHIDEHGSQKSPATRLSGSFSLLLAVVASLFLLPKSRLTGLLIIAVVCVSLCSAQNDSPITITIGLPKQVTQVCVNGNNNCNTPNLGGLDPTSPPTNPPSGSGSTSASVSSSSSTSAASSATATTGDSSTSGSTSTTGTSAPPTNPPAALHFQLKVLILSGGIPSGYQSILNADFAALAFDAVGMQYDWVDDFDTTTDLSSYLDTSSTGKYSGIVTVYGLQGNDLLSADQRAKIAAYQSHFGVKWVQVGNTGNSPSYSGIQVSNSGASTEEYFVSLAPEFASYGQYLNQTISASTRPTINWSAWQTYSLNMLQVTVTDSSSVTPALYATDAAGNKFVAAAVIKNADKTETLVYFLQQGADYLFSMAFSQVMVNWISPAGIYMGARRLTFLVQPDDLFLGSYIWDQQTHTNPVGTDPNAKFYRITADDYQLLADNLDKINAALPAESYVTIEWPTNFGGVNNSYYLNGVTKDDLLEKVIALMDKFYFLSHTWDHPCTLDNMTSSVGYSNMTVEVELNIAYAPGFFKLAGDDAMKYWSNSSMITPCVQGLYNGGVLRAMAMQGITAAVSDESVKQGTVDYEPINPYHGTWTTNATNGYAGVYLVPRVALDIDYCARFPADVADQYSVENPSTPLDFESIMHIQRVYALADLLAFRHDPYMLHQTNAMGFAYTDPTPNAHFGFGSSYNTSLVGLFVQRVVGDLMSYYSMPIVTKQMDDVVQMFQQRDAMDNCGLTTTIGVTNGNVVDVSISSTGICQMSLSGVQLSGSTVDYETLGSETTSWIDFASATTQAFSLATPLPL